MRVEYKLRYHCMSSPIFPLVKVYEEAADLQIGQTKRINHGADCPAGHDKRRRLYITRSADGANPLLLYCHNCGQGTAIPWQSPLITPTTPPSLPVPALTTERNIEWPVFSSIMGYRGYYPINTVEDVHVTMYLEARGFKGETMRAIDDTIYSFRYNPVKRSLLQPIWNSITDENGDTKFPFLAATIERYFGTDPYQSRWINTYYRKDWLPPVLRFEGHNTDSLIITEDNMSALRIAYHDTWNVRAMPLLGTHMSVATLLKIKSLNPEKVLVWLDNDSPTVIKRAQHITSLIKTMIPQSSVLCMDDKYMDAKFYDDDVIKEVLNEYNIS